MSKEKIERELSSDQERSEDLRKLGEKLKSAKAASEPNIEKDATSWAIGVNYASAFVGSVIVAGGIGYSIDYFASTKPWGLMSGVVIGFIAGTRSIVQMAQKMSKEYSSKEE